MGRRELERRPARPPKIAVANEELVTVRDAMRELNRIVDALEAGEQEKAVLTRKGKMVAVVVPIEVFARATSETRSEIRRRP